MVAVSEGRVGVELRSPNRLVGGGLGDGSDGVAEVEQLPNGDDAGSRQVKEAEGKAVRTGVGGEEGVAPKWRSPAPSARH